MRYGELNRNRITITALMIVGLIFSVVSYYNTFGWHINFLDTDDHMRVVRIREFFTHFDLSNNVIARCNVPFGCSLHWTRFYDFLLIIPSYLLSFFTDSINNAIDYVCFCASPIMKCVSIAVFFRIGCRIFKKYDVNILVSIFLAHVILINSYSFGRPDHHAFIILFELLFIDAVIRIVCNNFNRTKDYAWASLISALCVWISPETLIPILVVDALFFFLAIGGIGSLKNLLLQNTLTALFVGVIILDSISNKLIFFTIMVLAALAFSASLPSEMYARYVCKIRVWMEKLKNVVVRPDTRSNSKIRYVLYAPTIKSLNGGRWLSWFIVCPLFFFIPFFPRISNIEYDKISIVHFSLFICASIFLLMVAPRALINSAFTSKIVQKYHSKEDSKVENESSVTLGWTLVALICVAAVFLITYPKFFHGMEGDISEYVKLIWLSKVHEMMPVLASEFGIDFMIYALVTLIAATNKIHSLIDKRLCRSSIIWLIFILNAIFYTILTFFSVRMLQFSVLFGLPMLVDLGMNSKLTESFSRISRVILTFSLTIGVYFTSSVMLDPFTASVTLTLDSFTLDSTSHPYKAIDDLSDIPVVIMASSNDGPKLLYYTKHSVVGAPYHRQQEGIISSHKVMHDVFSEKTVGKILLDTNSSYIFIKRSNYTHKKAGGKTSLAGMIVHNINVPPWITIVKLPKKFDDITIAKVNKKMLMERLK